MEFDEESTNQLNEIGSDELLSDDNLRLPENANPLVRLHAVRAWLTRRQTEIKLEMGKTALTIQDMQMILTGEHLRRRDYQDRMDQIYKAQQSFQEAQDQISTYEEVASLLEDCVNHTTVGERLLVEYYLQLDDLVQTSLQENQEESTPRLQALMEVQHRVEHVGATYEED
jgi:hypothetical protein